MSSSIVTIQLGNYANFVGSHYWNIHEYALSNHDGSIDPDVYYSEGLTSNNIVTYTPRLISLDWKENLGVNIIDDIYEEIENEGKVHVESRRDIESLKVHSYSGNVDIHTGFTEKELNTNKRAKLTRQTDYTYWNEYLYSRYHPRTLNALPKLHRGLDKDNFNSFSQGQSLANHSDFRENMEEQTRYFVEKCDTLQGFQILCDGDGGFSGVASTWLEHINDEYRQPVLTMPVTCSHISSIESTFNVISLLTSFNSLSVATLPLSLMSPNNSTRSFENVNFDKNSNYHTSAIIALALKSLLLPCVLKHKLYSLSDFSCLVGGRSNSLVSLALSMPLPLRQQESLCTTLSSSSQVPLFTTLNPFSTGLNNVESAIGNILGVPDCRVLSSQERCHSLFRHCNTAADTMELYISERFRSPQVRFFSLPNSVKLSEPFPEIFSSKIDGINGEIMVPQSNQKAVESFICPKSVPLSTMLFVDDSCNNFIRLYDEAKVALNRNKLSDVLSANERDSLVDILESFRNLF